MTRYLISISTLVFLATGLLAQAKENPFGPGGGIFEEEEIEKPPSRLAAVGLSLLVPGAGELYLGDKRGATLFFSAEGAIWAGFTGFTVYANWRKGEYRDFTAIHAGSHPDGKDDQFFDDLLYYGSRDSYNYWTHLIYRDTYPLYPETEEYFWEWESDDAWDEYAEIHSSSERAFRSARTVLGVALINRVISVVHVLRMDTRPSADRSSRFIPTAFVSPSPDGSLNLGIGLVKVF